MPAPDFALTLKRQANGTTVLVLAGELDLYRVPDIERALAEAIEPGADRQSGNCALLPADGRHSSDHGSRRLVVDLQAVTFLDSTTLALLLAASGRQHARGGTLLVLVGPQTPTPAFEVTGVDRLLEIGRVGTDRSGTAA
jgi:anti-anti-sigma regulatory factor